MASSTPTRSELDTYYRRLWRRTGSELGPPERRRWRVIARQVHRHAGRGPHRVLDYGCGGGRLLGVLATLGPLDAFDVTPSVLEDVARRHPDLRLIAGDGTFPSPLEGDAYQVVVSSEVIEHVEDQAGLAADLYRVVAPGGLLCLTTPNARFEARYKAGTSTLQPIEQWLDAPGLRALVTAAGFEVLDLSSHGGHWSNLPYQRSAPYRLAKRACRRLWLALWQRLDDAESRLATLLGRGITLTLAARKPATSLPRRG